MHTNKDRRRIVKELLNITDKEFTDDELIKTLISTSVTANVDKKEKTTFGQKAADAVAKFAGSWAFIFSFITNIICSSFSTGYISSLSPFCSSNRYISKIFGTFSCKTTSYQT